MYETDYEFDQETQDFEDSFEAGLAEETDFEFDAGEMSIDEVEEMALAAELLEITTEEELDQFLGKIFKKVWRGVKKIAKPLGGVLKGVAKVALPIAGKVAGGFFGGPVGAAIGGKLGSAASGIFGAEIEGMSAEDQSFEVARRFVRLAASSAARAGRAPAGVNLHVAARNAVRGAARRHAPGLLRRKGPYGRRVAAASAPVYDEPFVEQSGRWVRQGSHIVILDA